MGTGQLFTPAVDLDAATLERFTGLFLLTPVEVFHAVLPEMRERGDGAVLMTTGYSAVQPMPNMSGPGPVMSGARNYLYSLNAELAGTGVYAATLTIAAVIAGSESAEAFTSPADAPAGAEDAGPAFPSVHPDQLAEHYWDMYIRRDRVEQAHPVELTPQVSVAV